MAYQIGQQAGVPPAMPSGMVAPQLAGIQAQQPIPQPGMPQPGQAPVNPALTASVLGLQGQQSQQAQIDRQLKLADSLRADSKDQLQGQQVGRVYKSAGLANLAASLVDSYGAAQMGKQANAKAGALDTGRTQAMTDYFNALTGNYQPPGTSTPRNPTQ